MTDAPILTLVEVEDLAQRARQRLQLPHVLNGDLT